MKIQPVLRRAPFAAPAVILFAFVSLAVLTFGRLFLLIEYRDSWSRPANVGAILDIFTLHGTYFGRDFGLFTDAVAATLFGPVAIYHNTFQILTIAAAALLFYLAYRRLVPDASPIVPCLGMIWLLFSTPVIDSLNWQATMLDKLCLFFSALATYALSRFDLQRMTRARILLTNALFLVITLAAYNSKESSFALVPSLLILAVIRASGSAKERLATAIKALAAPLAYAVLHVCIVFAWLRSNQAQTAHSLGGNMARDVYSFVAFLLNFVPSLDAMHLWPYAPLRFALLYVGIVVTCLAVIGVLVVRFADRKLSVLWIWSALSLLMAFAISMRAEGVAGYYMLVPQFYLAWLVCITVSAIDIGSRGKAVVCAVLALLFLAGFIATAPPYLRTERESANFTSALSQVKAYVASLPAPPRHIAILWTSAGYWNAYQFIVPSGRPWLAPYLSDSKSPAVLENLDARIEQKQYDSEPPATSRVGTLTVVLGRGLTLVRIIGPS